MLDKTISYNSFVNLIKEITTTDEVFKLFLRALKHGDFEICQAFLDAGVDVNIQETTYGNTLLVDLAFSSKLTVEIADWLVTNGADINKSANVIHHTPLSVACSNGNIELVKYFLKKGAKPLLYKYTVNASTLSMALCSGRGTPEIKYEIVKLLFENGASVNDVVNEFTNPFMHAVTRKYTNIVKLFLEHGIDANIYYSCGRTALHLAVDKEDIATAKLLLEYGADANLPLKEKCSFITEYNGAVNAMDMAIVNKQEEMINLLSAYGACASERFKKLQKIFELTSDKDVADIIKLSIESQP